ncbi:MAG: Arm DNA-binding domain-containing protein, partial [Thermoanaerobaculia bacterium]
MPVVHLTDRFIRHASTEKQVEDFRDEAFPGFGLRVTERGRKTFFIVYPVGGRRRRLGLGKYPIVGLKRARQKAR